MEAFNLFYLWLDAGQREGLSLICTCVVGVFVINLYIALVSESMFYVIWCRVKVVVFSGSILFVVVSFFILRG